MNEGGLVGSNGILRYLSDLRHEIILVDFYSRDNYTDEEKSELQKYVSEIHTVKLHFSNTALNLSLKYPNNIRKYTRLAMKELLCQLKQRIEFDFIVIDHVQMFEYAKLFPSKRIILHTHNLESDLWYEHAKKCNMFARPFVLRSARLLKEYEKAAFLSADGVLACCEADKDKFLQLVPESNVAVMPSYVKFERVKTFKDIQSENHTILFIGSFSWRPNQSAANYLIDKVMPLLREECKDCKLYLVGKAPTEEMNRKADGHDDIVITGLVDSVDPYIRMADVFVNSVEYGSGINIKVIEAMGKGIPVVSTEFGARGLNVVSGRDILLFNTPETCVRQLIRLFEDKELSNRISDSARERYLEFITPGEAVQRMLE